MPPQTGSAGCHPCRTCKAQYRIRIRQIAGQHRHRQATRSDRRNLARQTGYIQCCRPCGYCRHGPLQRQAFETACRERQTSADTTRHSGEPYHRHRRWRGRPCSSDTGKHAAPCEQARRDHDYRHQVTRTGRQAFANPYPGPGRLPGYHDRKPRPATGRGFFVPPCRSCLAEMRT